MMMPFTELGRRETCVDIQLVHSKLLEKLSYHEETCPSASRQHASALQLFMYVQLFVNITVNHVIPRMSHAA